MKVTMIGASIPRPEVITQDKPPKRVKETIYCWVCGKPVFYCDPQQEDWHRRWWHEIPR